MALKRILIAGGGTGGHIFPAVAVANALKKANPDVEILFVGAKGKMEMEKVPQAGYKIEGLDIAGFDRSSLIKNISLPIKLIKSFWQVKQIFKTFRPDAAFGVGGYSSFPVLKYAQQKGIPTFIHESNAFAGKSNILLGKNATLVMVAASGMEKFFPKEKIVVTGNPIRAKIADTAKISKLDAVNAFGLAPAKKVVFAMGGSLGAKSINESMDAGIGTLLENDLQVIWQTGKLYAEQAKKSTGNKPGVYTSAFISDMETAYAAADYIVSRAGAMSVAELCVVGKPVIFVPFPFAAEDHQTANAKSLVDKHAALMISDNEVRSKLINELLTLNNDTIKAETLSRNIKESAVASADVTIADLIIKNV
ncbi:undecaprenyldiphospho-muramoylpentapeptide beta-N-acetylglucosaminyltransferase [Polluticaenibacter yanchengensis]|uniref:UDP-N-acetylglucosamine--N-acetylmuramyl-(pentapeptide) pyrophosphoryl-undecaprenol N-acetylglucosamine transferase n=1 Tax=Polluticaenibacter yanchengensis TaxID=3014562 RepID=A0ABT4UFP1_9BACT|nr:undecaprenyldiphospho-muramoylpentapeptide beta-N-acetylglucosaminyltransferase [Chitinophagaceae bacterium LY-5]